jgi:hypothetical protein
MGDRCHMIINYILKIDLYGRLFSKLIHKKQYQLPFIGLIPFLLLLSGCVTNMPAYISSTQAEKIPDVILLFNKEQGAPVDEYSGVYILPIKPEKYYEQNVPYCGGFSVAGIISAYHLDANEPVSTYMSRLGRLVGGMGPTDIIKSLELVGMKGTIHRANRFSDSCKIDLLRSELDKGCPVIMLIGNGFNKDGTYSDIKSQGITHLHWITLWGYHDSGFFVYDSVAHPYQYELVPIGNVERSGKEILRDWIRPFYLSPVMGNTYITLGD